MDKIILPPVPKGWRIILETPLYSLKNKSMYQTEQNQSSLKFSELLSDLIFNEITYRNCNNSNILKLTMERIKELKNQIDQKFEELRIKISMTDLLPLLATIKNRLKKLEDENKIKKEEILTPDDIRKKFEQIELFENGKHFCGLWSLLDDQPIALAGKCDICGNPRVFIRPRAQEEVERNVCPTCIADKIEQINDISSSYYNYTKTKEGSVGGVVDESF